MSLSPLTSLAINRAASGLGAGIPTIFSAWNPSDKDVDITLSDSDRTATIVAALGLVRGTQSHDAATANRYFEVRHSSATSYAAHVGVARSTAALTDFPGKDANGWSYLMSAQTKWNNNSSAAASVSPWIGVKLDLDAGTIEFVRGGIALGIAYSGLSGTFYPAWGPGTSGAGSRSGFANFGASQFKYGLPSGYTAWDAGATWNSVDKDADITLSLGDLLATINTANGAVRATTGRSSGKYYFEV